MGFSSNTKASSPLTCIPQHGTAMLWGEWISESARPPGALHWPWSSRCHPAQTGGRWCGEVSSSCLVAGEEEGREATFIQPPACLQHCTAYTVAALPHPAALIGMKPRSCGEHPALPTPLNRTGHSWAPGSNSTSVVVSTLQSLQIHMWSLCVPKA